MIRLVCIDVDGTLVGASGVVHPEIWTATLALRRRGLRLALCSGRPAFGLARDYASRLDPDGWHVFQNGASVVHLPDGASRSRALPPELVTRLVALARAQDRILELYGDTEYAAERDLPPTRAHAELLGVRFEPRPFESLPGPIVRAQWLATPATAPQILAEAAWGLERVPSGSPVMPETVFINMTAAGVHKGSGVAEVASAYGIPLTEVMMVGDAGNDLPALRMVGHSVAMGNAEPSVRAAAHRVVGDVEAGGLLEALAAAATDGP